MMGMGLGPDGRRRGRGSGFGRAPDSEESSTSEEPPLSTDIGTLSMEGDHEWKSILHIEGMVMDLQISPDGKWMAYSSMGSGENGVFVRPFPDADSGEQRQISTVPALSCLWSSTSRELFYVSGKDTSFMMVEVETEPTFKVGQTIALFKLTDIGLDRRAIISGFDISPDGRQFLMLKEAEIANDESQAEEPTTSQPNKIIFVTNWFEELKKLAPAD